MTEQLSIAIDSIIWQPNIYPRGKWNSHTIEMYADAIRAGAKFPPIALQEGTNVLLDGKHRLEAHKLYAEMYQAKNGSDDTEWPEPAQEIDAEYHVIPDGVPVKLYCASLSTKHGDRIAPADRKALAREIYEENPDFTLEVLGKYLGVHYSTAGSYVKDILGKRKEEQQATIARLDAIGWTQREIGEKVKITQPAVNQFLISFLDHKKLIKNQLTEGIPHADLAQRSNLHLPLVWSMALESLDDAQRMSKLSINVQPYDVWTFSSCHDLFGNQHPGRIPGQLIAHVLYFYTNQGDTVIDPMVGSGTTIDVCMVMGRKCYGYDIDSRHERPDVIAHNIAKDGWPDRVKKADLIFWDPPYFDKMDSSRIGADGYIDGSISKLPRQEYLDFFSTALAEAKSKVKKGTRLAFLMSDWNDNDGEKEGIFVWDYANLIQGAGWTLKRHIQTPLSTQQVHGDIVKKFRVSRKLARLERYLLIAEA